MTANTSHRLVRSRYRGWTTATLEHPMSEQPDRQSAGRTPLAPAAAGVLRAQAAAARASADQFAAALEDIAEHGLPQVEACRPWSEIREEALRQLHAAREGHAA